MKKLSLKRKLGESLYNFLKRNFNDDLLLEQLPKLFGNLSDMRYIDENDYNAIYTLRVAPEKIGGFFMFGNRDNMKEYRELYRESNQY